MSTQGTKRRVVTMKFPKPRTTRLRWAVAATALLALVGSVSALAAHAKSVVTVSYQFPYFGTVTDVSAVQSALNKRLASQGIAVNLQPIAYAAWGEKMKLQFAAGQRCDVVFTASWTNNYYQLVQNGGLLPLDNLLKTVGQGVYKTLTPATWNAAKVNGHIYGVINQQTFPKAWGFTIRKDLAAKYGVNARTVKKYSDLTPFLAKIKSDGITPILSDDGSTGVVYHDEVVGFDPLLSAAGFGYADVGYQDKLVRVFNPVATPQFKRLAQLAYQWHQAGYMAQTPPPSADAVAGAKAGKYGIIIHLAGPGLGASYGATYGDTPGWTDGVPLGPTFLSTSGITSTLNGICRSSAHPREAMKFLNAINTDPTAFDLLSFGVAGKHYQWTSKQKKLISVPTSSGWNPGTPWMFGDTFHGLYTDPGQVGTFPKQAKINADSVASKALGFAPNTDSITNEVAQVSTAATQCMVPILKGLVDPNSAIPTCIDSMNAAGEGKILSELQTQLTAWRKH